MIKGTQMGKTCNKVDMATETYFEKMKAGHVKFSAVTSGSGALSIVCSSALDRRYPQREYQNEQRLSFESTPCANRN